jgi:co-chaperonin GroES (HSP10)
MKTINRNVIVALPTEIDQKTKGGILMPILCRKPSALIQGKVVAVADDCTLIEVGDEAHFLRVDSLGEVQVDDQQCMIVSEDAILMVVTY